MGFHVQIFHILNDLSTEIENIFVKMWTEISTLLFLHLLSTAWQGSGYYTIQEATKCAMPEEWY